MNPVEKYEAIKNRIQEMIESRNNAISESQKLTEQINEKLKELDEVKVKAIFDGKNVINNPQSSELEAEITHNRNVINTLKEESRLTSIAIEKAQKEIIKLIPDRNAFLGKCIFDEMESEIKEIEKYQEIIEEIKERIMKLDTLNKQMSEFHNDNNFRVWAGHSDAIPDLTHHSYTVNDNKPIEEAAFANPKGVNRIDVFRIPEHLYKFKHQIKYSMQKISKNS